MIKIIKFDVVDVNISLNFGERQIFQIFFSLKILQ
jgi:hypothetical protein